MGQEHVLTFRTPIHPFLGKFESRRYPHIPQRLVKLLCHFW
jgi:hypothetical protein